MRLLLTRPTLDGEASARHLRALGHEVVCSPVIEIVPLDITLPDDGFDIIVVTSANAFASERVKAWLVQQRAPVHVVGEKSLEAALAAGVPPEAVVMAGQDGAGLLAGLTPLPTTRFLYLAGRDRKPLLEAGLRARGHQVAVAETYAANPAPSLSVEAVAALLACTIDGALHYSRRSAEIFLRLAGEAGVANHTRHIQHFCLSTDIAEPLLAAGAGHVMVATVPDESSLLALGKA